MAAGGEKVINGERKKNLFEPGRAYMELHYPILSASAGLKFSTIKHLKTDKVSIKMFGYIPSQLLGCI